jgi:ubiquinone/menaquinone biosynthesis C-methylase UbiE
MQNPEQLLAPYLRKGMTVLEPGPGMGFFTLPMAALVGASGRVVALDLQEKMLEKLRRRANKAGVQKQIEARVVGPESMGLEDLRGKADFALAFAVVHEVPSAERFFAELAAALKTGGQCLLAEPGGHVSEEVFAKELEAAAKAGFQLVSRPPVQRSLAAVLRKGK